MNKFNGFLYGLLSSASFGLIPLFTIPIMWQGMEFGSILLYRFIFATIALAFIMLISKESFRIQREEIFPLCFLAFLYLMSALFLFWSYEYMPSGIATTLHFMYPVITTFIMMFLFGERKSIWRIGAIILAVTGVYFLSNETDSGHVNWIGIVIVLLSAVGYALYLITIGQMKVGKMKGIKLTFYVFLIGSFFLLLGNSVLDEIQPINNWNVAGNLIMLALVPTVISNLALVRAIKSIGSTLTSVLGAMEPVTAVCVGICVFNEPLTYGITLGVALIIAAVTVIILKQ